MRRIAEVDDWLAAASIAEGPVLRGMRVGGRVLSGCLSTECARRVVHSRACRIGIHAGVSTTSVLGVRSYGSLRKAAA